VRDAGTRDDPLVEEISYEISSTRGSLLPPFGGVGSLPPLGGVGIGSDFASLTG